MAKPRKSKINKINNRDRLAFEALAKGGTISVAELTKVISKTRIDSWAHEKYFKKLPDNDNDNTKYTDVMLTKEGKEFARKQFGITSCTKSKENTQGHDRLIGSKIMSLPQESRSKCRTEEELWDKLYEEMRHKKDRLDDLDAKRLDRRLSVEEREIYRNRWLYEDKEYLRIEELLESKMLSAPDISYVNADGVEVCYEVITSNYSQAEIEAKIKFAKILGMEIEFQER